MGWCLFKQPNGRLARFSTVVDDVTHYDMTEAEALDQCLDWCSQEQAAKAVANAVHDLDHWFIGPTSMPISVTSRRYRRAMRTIRDIHGPKRANRRRRQLSQPPPEQTK